MFAATRGRGRGIASARNAYSTDSSSTITSSSSSSERSTRSFIRGQSRGSRPRRRYQRFMGNPAVPQPPGRDLLDGLQPLPIQTFNHPKPVDIEEIVAQDVRYVASYTWLDSKEPAIIVPGSPRIWRNRPLPYSVTPDAGLTSIYLNGDRVPSSPLLPMFRAIETMQADPTREKLDWSTIDFVTDRNNLRKLLGWIEPSSTVAEEFRIDLQLCGVGTVLMQRYEARMMFNADQSGFSDTFELENTRAGPGCAQGALGGHHRIVTYNFHRMKIMLRCEVDACFPSEDADPSEEKAGSSGDSADDLAEALSSLSVADPAPRPPSSHGPAEHVCNDSARTEMKIVRGGIEIPQASLLKINTRSEKNMKFFDWVATYIQLFLGQIPTLLLGIHHMGTFFELRECRMDSQQIVGAAKKAQHALKRLRRLLDEIHYIVMHHDTVGRLSLVCQGGVLRIYERQSSNSFLPDEILAQF